MKKSIARVFILCLILLNFLPLLSSATGRNAPPDKPYEKVAAEIGRWHTESLTNNGKTNLMVGFVGSWKSSGEEQITFEIKENIVLSGVYIPIVEEIESEPVLSLIDAAGNSYKGFAVEKQTSYGIKESRQQNSSEIGNTYIFTPNGDITLPKGEFTLSLEGTEKLTGDFLLKGYHLGAYERYRQSLLSWELENNRPNANDVKTEQIFGKVELTRNNEADFVYGGQEATLPPVFALDAEYQIDEIIVSTFNNGKGAAPGNISIMDANGEIVYSGQSYGVSIENIPNGAWKIEPNMLLPAGSYSIALSQQEVLSYDQAGEPLFYVKVSLPVQLREDFTGTYKINLDTYKTSTLMGKVAEKSSSFSLKDFELIVLDKGTELELIGKYEGLPFSQRCEIIEETAEKVVARFDFAADLTQLPYNAKISAEATLNLVKDANGAIQIGINGTADYQRAASAERGADHNTYDIKASGIMLQRELPPFVMTVLGKAGGAGKIPGPDNAAQAAAGILFPPLAGLVVSILQEAIKTKAHAKGAVRDKNWYKKKFPGKTDEQIAMIMLADAMGNTDNPDEGDAVSIGDNELNERSSSHSIENEFGSDYEEDGEPRWETEEDQRLESEIKSDSKELEEKSTIKDEEFDQEPETIVVQTSANGAQTLFVKDPKTGEWVDPQTNSVLDIEKHGEALEQIKREQEWSDREFDKLSLGDTDYDKALRNKMKIISQEEDHEKYKNLLRKKYGIDDLVQVATMVAERRNRAAEWAEIWRRNDKLLGIMEYGAVAVGTAADVGIDGLAIITPGGKKFRAGYKVLKGVAGTMATAGAEGKDIINWGNVTEGAVKGGADAVLDYIPGSGVKTIMAKGGVNILGESAGSAAGAALRGEDTGKALIAGIKSGAYKATVGAVTDMVAGDLPNPIVTRGSFRAVPNMKNVILSKPSATKIGATFIDEYGIKPVVIGD